MTYQRQYSDHPPATRAFAVLDRLWMVCEEYYEDIELRNPGDTTDRELTEEAQRALDDLGGLYQLPVFGEGPTLPQDQAEPPSGS